MRGVFLKIGATLLTVATTVVSAFYVTSHLKNASAPLQPAVLSSGQDTSANVGGGKLTLGPSVQPSNVQPVTSTYAS